MVIVMLLVGAVCFAPFFAGSGEDAACSKMPPEVEKQSDYFDRVEKLIADTDVTNTEELLTSSILCCAMMAKALGTEYLQLLSDACDMYIEYIEELAEVLGKKDKGEPI